MRVCSVPFWYEKNELFAQVQYIIVDMGSFFSPIPNNRNITMWQKIKEKVQAGILAYWSQTVWFVAGVVLGATLLGGLIL